MSKKTQFIPSGAISSTPNMASARIPLPHYLDISAITFGSVKKGWILCKLACLRIWRTLLPIILLCYGC